MREKFTIVKKGYSPEEVDEYIESLEQENKGYKEKDNAIKNAIIYAQIAADNIIKDAHIKSNELQNQTLRRMEVIKKLISGQKAIFQEFLDDFNTLKRRYITDVDKGDTDSVFGKIEELEAFFSEFEKDNDNSEETSEKMSKQNSSYSLDELLLL